MISFVTWFHFAGFAVLVCMTAYNKATERADTVDPTTGENLSWWPHEEGGAFRFGLSTATSAAGKYSWSRYSLVLVWFGRV